MELEILFYSSNFEEIKSKIEIHFNQAIKLHREGMSIFEQYQVRPVERFIPEIWKYRIVCKSGVYHFGRIMK